MQMEHYQQISGHNNHPNARPQQQIHNQQMPSQPPTPHQQQPLPLPPQPQQQQPQSQSQSQNNNVDLSIVKQESRPKKKSKKQKQQQQQRPQPMGKSLKRRMHPNDICHMNTLYFSVDICIRNCSGL